MSEDCKKLLDELIKERDFIEKSLRQSIRELEEIGVGPNDSLVDSEGYPRVDIDLYRVRSLKSSISRQQNDHKALMKRIEALLPQVLPSQNNLNSFDINMRIGPGNLEPFAKIGIVPTGSQAFKAGLCTNDLILKFGDLTKETFKGKDLNMIATEFSHIKASRGVLELKIKRSDDNTFTFKFDCKQVESLGCQILLL